GYMVTQKAPYKNVLFYRYVMDKNGVKMSKSLGNGIEGREAIENWGSDGVRYYLLTKRAPEDQINFDPDEFSNVSGFFNTFDNVCNFMNSFLEELEFSKNETLVLEKLGVEDKWIYLKLNKLVRDFARNIEDNMHMNAFKDVEDFIVRDLSKTYLKVVKERV